MTSFRRDREGDTFRGWLRVITAHKIHDHFRRSAEKRHICIEANSANRNPSSTQRLDELHPDVPPALARMFAPATMQTEADYDAASIEIPATMTNPKANQSRAVQRSLLALRRR